MTNYELGVLKLIPMPTHLMLDIGGGIILAASPWLFRFADNIWWPHLVVGLFSVVAGLITHTQTAHGEVGEGGGMRV